MADVRDERALAQVRELVAEAVQQLLEAGVPTQPLAEYEPSRRVALLFRRASRLVEVDRVWRLGVLLVNQSGALYATGHTTRAVDPGWPQHVAQSAEIRREYRAAAVQGGFAEGETINIEAAPIQVDLAALAEGGGPLFLRDGVPVVRWAPGIGDELARPLADYLHEQVELACHPPRGSTD